MRPLLSPEEATALLGVLPAGDQTFADVVTGFDEAFPHKDQFRACCGIALLLEVRRAAPRCAAQQQRRRERRTPRCAAALLRHCASRLSAHTHRAAATPAPTSRTPQDTTLLSVPQRLAGWCVLWHAFRAAWLGDNPFIHYFVQVGVGGGGGGWQAFDPAQRGPCCLRRPRARRRLAARACCAAGLRARVSSPSLPPRAGGSRRGRAAGRAMPAAAAAAGRQPRDGARPQGRLRALVLALHGSEGRQPQWKQRGLKPLLSTHPRAPRAPRCCR